MTHRETAELIAGDCISGPLSETVTEIEAALAAAERKGMERAAEMVNNTYTGTDAAFGHWIEFKVAAIRAQAAKEW